MYGREDFSLRGSYPDSMRETWARSSADVRERWRDVAEIVRGVTSSVRSDELAETLQMVFWLGTVFARSGKGSRGEAGLRSLLPESGVEPILREPGSRRSKSPSVWKAKAQGSRSRC